MRYTVIIERGRESGYVAVCPALPGCVSQGRTKREVLKNIREAIEAYVAAAGLTSEEFRRLLT